LERVHQLIRRRIKRLDEDRSYVDDFAAIMEIVDSDEFRQALKRET
jgi:histidine ammonia-lyase